jgi:hypothetical protein
MKSPIRWSIALALAGLAASEAQAVGRLADVVVVDRESGAVLPVHRHRGEWWVEGRPGARYAIRVRNAGGERLLAVTSVDGVNVVTGETAAVDQPGYIYDGWRSWDITGWRKSDEQVAAFEFTSVPRSYAARTDRPDNVGVIGVALFRERRIQPALSEAESRTPRFEESTAMAKADAAADAPRATAPALGTGHGRRESSVVTRVDFERAGPRPDEVIRVRYDSRANLLAMGVIPSPPPRPRRPDPFPSGHQLGYVPDP